MCNTADNDNITQSQARDTRHRRMQEVNSLCTDILRTEYCIVFIHTAICRLVCDYLYNKEQVRPSSGKDVYPHMPILRQHAARFHQRCIHVFQSTSWRRRAGRFVRFWASGGAKFPKMGDSLPCTPINRRAKFDAAVALSSAEKSVNVQTHRKKQQPIYPHLTYRHV